MSKSIWPYHPPATEVKEVCYVYLVYFSVCLVYVFQGEDIKSELVSLLDELPELYKGISGAISNLKNATQYYETFVHFLVPRFVFSLLF